MSQDPYSVDYLEVLQEKDKRKSFGRRRAHYLAPGKDQKKKESIIRPAFNPDQTQNHGQPQPIVRAGIHDGLDENIPGTKRKLFPGIKPGVRTLPCLNEHDDDDYCEVCPAVDPIAKKARDLKNDAQGSDSSKLKKAAKTWGMYLGKVKRTWWYYFACFLRLGEIDDIDEAKEAGKVGVTDKGEITDDLDEAKWILDPLLYVKIKAWWMGPFFEKINEKKYSKGGFAKKMNKGKMPTDEEYQKRCPKKRTSPFHPETGWDMEVVVEGKQLKQEWNVRVDDDEATPLSKKDLHLLKKDYPNFMQYVKAPGEEDLLSFEEWLEQNEGGNRDGYRHYCKSELREKQKEILYANKAPARGEDPFEDDGDDEEDGSDGEAEDLKTFDINEEEDEGGSDFDPEDVEEDIPF